MHKLFLCCVAISLTYSTAAVSAGKGIRFWNLTSATIVRLYLSPAGQDRWGANQCENDRDGSVDHDERLKIVGVEPGRYDAKLADKTGRTCLVKNIDIEPDGIFSVEEKDLTDCKQ